MSAAVAQDHLKLAGAGLAFGFFLSWVGFSDWGEVHRMFAFADLRLLLTFGGAVVLAGVAFAFVPGARQSATRPIHPGTVAGGVMFGVGWALCGACPSIALVQVGEGQLSAGLTVLGVLLGTWGYGLVHKRFFHWDPGSCEL